MNSQLLPSSTFDLTEFTYDGSSVRTVDVDGDPWFVASDVANILEYRMASDMTRIMDADTKGTQTVRTPGGAQTLTIISEAGLYDVILRREAGYIKDATRRGSVKAFQRWITHEVLPQIRKTGAYAVKEISRLELIDMARESEMARIAALEAYQFAESRVLELAGPATAWAKLASAKGDLDVRDAAQVLCRDHNIQIGRNRLFGWLRANRWIDSNNRPYQTRVDQGLLTEKVGTFVIQRSAGEMLAPPQLRITAKGLQRLQAELSPVEAVA